MSALSCPDCGNFISPGHRCQTAPPRKAPVTPDPFSLLPDLVKVGYYRRGQDDYAQVVHALADALESHRKKAIADKLRRIVGIRMELSTLEALTRQQRDGSVFIITPDRDMSTVYLPAAQRQAVDLLLAQWKGADRLRAQGIDPSNRVMLFGPTGCGKTALAEAVAFELGLTLLIVNAGNLIGSMMGESAGRLCKIFDAVKSPCVLFLDECDSLATRRSSDDAASALENRRIVNTLLMQLDKILPHVLLLAATNAADMIDDAAWNRFDLAIHVPAPSPEAVHAVAAMRLGDSHPAAISIVTGHTWTSLREVERACDHIRRALILGICPQQTLDVLRKTTRDAA